MAQLPIGTITFLFTDIEGSTQLWEKHPEAMQAALAHHDVILREAVEAQGGRVVKATGDGLHAVFDSAPAGLLAALAAQQALNKTSWETLQPHQLKVRMGLHTGDAEMRADDYFSPAVNRAARLTAVANGGQVLLSAATAELVRDQLPTDVTLVDLGMHRLKDLIRPEHVFQPTHPALPASFPPLRSVDAFPNNLPLQLTTFIGREPELREARQLLASTRLLTFIGPGGTGKTRLSLQLAADMLGTFPDGVWLAELASTSDPLQTPRVIADVFGLSDTPGLALVDQVTDYLRAKSILLLLDNCEHLIEACARLAEQLLKACPRLIIAASSREALGIAGETVYRVPSLTVPDPDQVTLDALAGFEAARLFIDRTSAAHPNFSLSERDAPAIAQICQRLDGIPLALEMAAARIQVFSPEQIASRLSDRFRLLTGGSRTALPRQQTLRATIDWSYDLLTGPEQTLLRRLSIFSGGWAFEAAEAVASELDVIDLLAQLVNKSLVTVEERADQTRYSLLETIRQYARDRLFDLGEAAKARDLHLEYFLRLAEQAEPELFGPNLVVWLNRLEVEHDNLRAALEWALESQPESALRLASALSPFWSARSYTTEMLRWCRAVLSRADSLPPAEAGEAQKRASLRARILFGIAWAYTLLGESAAARAAAEEGAVLARQADEPQLLARLLFILGDASTWLGDLDAALKAAHESETISRSHDYKRDLAAALGVRVAAAFALRGYDEALPDQAETWAYIKEVIALESDSSTPWSSPMQSIGVARIALLYGDSAAARRALEEGLAHYSAVGNRHFVNMCTSELAHITRHEGDRAGALAAYRETIVEWQRLGHRAAVAHQLECFAIIAVEEAQAPRAARLFGAAEALREACGSPMTAEERVEYELVVSGLRERMKPDAYRSAWAEGRALTMDQAVAAALEPMTTG